MLFALVVLSPQFSQHSKNLFNVQICVQYLPDITVPPARLARTATVDPTFNLCTRYPLLLEDHAGIYMTKHTGIFRFSYSWPFWWPILYSNYLPSITIAMINFELMFIYSTNHRHSLLRCCVWKRKSPFIQNIFIYRIWISIV